MRNKHSHGAKVIRKAKKGFLLFTGGTALLLGIVGIVVPILLSIVLIGKLFVGILLMCIAAAVTLHLMSFKTMSEENYRSFIEEYMRSISSGKKELP